MQEYRSLQGVVGWEVDDYQVKKMCGVVSNIVRIHRQAGSKDHLVKARLLARGVVKKIQTSRQDDASQIQEVHNLVSQLAEISTELANL